MKEDLIGKHFGHLTVIGLNEENDKWICQCDCGKTTEVLGYNLKQGNTKSCGHLKNGVGVKRRKNIDIYNNPIGQLMVINTDKDTQIATVKCLNCGRVVKMEIEKLKEMKRTRKKSYTCGLDGCVYKGREKKASVIENGSRFGELTVLERLPNKIVRTKRSLTSIPMYLCECTCGNQAEIQGRYLLDGRTKSCGCLRKKNFINKPNQNTFVISDCEKELYKIYLGWKGKFTNPSNKFKQEVINKNIKFFPELDTLEDPFRSFVIWANVNGFNIENGFVFLDRVDYGKDFSTTNCFWTNVRSRGY